MSQFAGARFLRVFSWALIAPLFWALSAHATTLVYLDVPGKARGADLVVHGKVVSSKARWSGDGRRIFTETTVRVEDTWKGQPTEQVLVRQPGGEVEGVGQRVDGVANLPEGQEVVLFLEARPGGAWLLHGMAQGKYRVERTSDGKDAWAVPEEAGHVRLLDPVTREEVTVTPKTLSLTDLRGQVAQAVGAAPEEGAPPSGTQKTPSGAGKALEPQ